VNSKTIADASVRRVAPAGSRTAKRGRHFPCFDGYRAIAATSVLIFHAAVQSGFTEHQHVYGAYTARLGDFGVSVFFVISGFLLYRPFADAHAGGRAAPALGQFYRNRVLRIVPAFWIALTVVVFVVDPHTVHSVWQFVAYYGFLQIYDSHLVLSGLAQAWSLGTEVTFYLALPMFGFVAAGLAGGPRRRLKDWLAAEVAVLAILYAAGVGFRSYVLFNHPSWTVGAAITWLPSRLDWFALGMTLAVVSVWAERTDRSPRFFAVLGDHPVVSVVFAAELYWLLARLGLSRGFAPDTPWHKMEGFFLIGLVAFFVILPGVFGPQHRGAIRGLLRSWPLRSLGVVSYGVFLWHHVWIDEEAGWIHRPTFWQLIVVSLPLAVATATLSYYLVERPVMSLKSRRAAVTHQDQATN
jgi:peptidoglycan/LPS O-acetylase OafA/YrhL